jgi:hypothetical protein
VHDILPALPALAIADRAGVVVFALGGVVRKRASNEGLATIVGTGVVVYVIQGLGLWNRVARNLIVPITLIGPAAHTGPRTDRAPRTGLMGQRLATPTGIDLARIDREVIHLVGLFIAAIGRAGVAILQ